MQDQQPPCRKDVAQAGKNLPALEKTEQVWSFWAGSKRYDFCEEDYQSLDGQPALFWAWLDTAGSLAELDIENGAIATFNTLIFKNLTLARQIFKLALKSPSLT
ncbi:hypothetical protein [Geoalkalibacter subterraneus]|nr:hypothetical protein [Geoalkalibacter subterraneus]